MATNNFCTMKKFDLWVMNTENFDGYDFRDAVEEMELAADRMNKNLMFHNITVKEGYYTGLQFFIEPEHELDAYNYDNDDCHYYFDMCKSLAYRKYQAEIKRINRELKKIGKLLGMVQILQSATFSDGSAFYKVV